MTKNRGNVTGSAKFSCFFESILHHTVCTIQTKRFPDTERPLQKSPQEHYLHGEIELSRRRREPIHSCITCPVALHDFAGFMMQVHGGVGFGTVIAAILVELCGLIRHLAGIAASFAVFQPQQVQRDTVLLQFLVDVIVVRHLVYRLC